MKITNQIILLFFILFFPGFLFAQKKYDPEKISKHSFRVNFLLPAAEYEVKFFEDFTLCVRAGFYFSPFRLSFKEGGSRYPFGSFGEGQIRRYFKTVTRTRRRSRLTNNSGSYFGLRGLYLSKGGFEEGPGVLLGPMYGLQRNFQGRPTFSFHGGPGLYLLGGQFSGGFFAGISVGLVYFEIKEKKKRKR